jgi:hypothetical protein
MLLWDVDVLQYALRRSVAAFLSLYLIGHRGHRVLGFSVLASCE